MAIWQFDIYLLPIEKLRTRYSQIPTNISGEDFSTELWWDGIKSPINIQQKLDLFLDRGNSWHSDLIVWGNENETRVDIYFSDINVKVIFIRIDVRKINMDLIQNLLNFAKYCNCYLFCPEDLSLIPPELNTLLSKVKKSKAVLFSQNLEEWLNKIIEENILH